MDKLKAMKSAISALGGFLVSIFGTLATPILLLISCNLIDYITGIFAARFRNQRIQSAVGMTGIIKKVCTWLLVAVGAIIDRLLLISSETVGLKLPFTYLVAIFVLCWLICNALLLIFQYMIAMGISLPIFSLSSA